MYIFGFVIFVYSVFELPIKKIFKSLLKRNEIVEEEEEEEEEEDEDEKEEKKGQNNKFNEEEDENEDEDEIRSFKN
jgi:flagellar biosynthesis/type III secretory pathway M-ring protein FliF/YscJ